MLNDSFDSAPVNPGAAGNPHTANGQLAVRRPFEIDSADAMIDLPETGYALAIVRLVLGLKVSGTTRKKLPAEWVDLAKFIEDSSGFQGQQLFDRVREFYMGQLRTKRPVDASRISVAIEAAWARAKLNSPGDEPEPQIGPPPFRFPTIDVQTFLSTIFKRDWLVVGLITLLQPLIVGGPKKTLKTSILIDLVVSLATATDFLGKFRVPRSFRVGFFSGESGGPTIQETIRRVLSSKGLEPEELKGITLGFSLPQLGIEEQIADLVRIIREDGLEVVIIDPIYLCLLAGPSGKAIDHANLFEMGPIFAAVAKACLDAGATPILVHHFRKARESPYEVPELEDLAFAGSQEFARQWMLIGRREKYKPGTGRHELWLTVGGSSGHSGEWALDVIEGMMDEDFGGRRWDVEVRLAKDAREEATQQKDTAKVEAEAHRNKLKAEAREKSDAAEAMAIVILLRDQYDGESSTRQLWDATGISREKFSRLCTYALGVGWITSVQIMRKVNRGEPKAIDGYRLAKDPGVIE